MCTLPFKGLGSVRFFFKEINTFIEKGHSFDFYIVTKLFYFK